MKRIQDFLESNIPQDKALHYLICFWLTMFLIVCIKPIPSISDTYWPFIIAMAICQIPIFWKEKRDDKQPGNKFSWLDIIWGEAGCITSGFYGMLLTII